MSASLIIAAFNVEATLGAAITSALAQDYEPLEVVVVDDGSTDRTAEIADSFTGVTVIRQQNAGPSAARNRGMEAATGEFIGFLDADDTAPARKISLQVEYLLEHPEVGCVLGRHELVGETPEWFDRDGVPLVSLVARRRLLLDVGAFDASLRIAEDRDLLVRLREHGVQIEFLPDVVLIRHFRGDNLSFNRPAEHPVFRSLKAKLDRARAEKPPAA